MGANWSLSVAYLGSHSDRLWAQKARNPAIYMGLGPCTIQGVCVYRCVRRRRIPTSAACSIQVNPAAAALIGALDENTDIGYQNYKGVKLSAVRRSGSGLTVNGTYTLGVCRGTPTATDVQPGEWRLLEAERPVVRRRLLRSGLPPHRVGHPRLRDAGGRQPRAARGGLALAGGRHRQRAIRRPSEHYDRTRHRLDRHRRDREQPAAAQSR